MCDGVPPHGVLESCTAGAGSLLVEFGLLSRLLGDPVYENLARKAVRALWDRRHSRTGLLGVSEWEEAFGLFPTPPPVPH